MDAQNNQEWYQSGILVDIPLQHEYLRKPMYKYFSSYYVTTSRGGCGDCETTFSFKINCTMQIYVDDRYQNSLRSLQESILSRSYARANCLKHCHPAADRCDRDRDPLAPLSDLAASIAAHLRAQLVK